MVAVFKAIVSVQLKNTINFRIHLILMLALAFVVSQLLNTA